MLQALKDSPFGVANFIVLGIYLAAMLVLGWWCSRHIKTSRSFFIADGRMGGVVVGMSLLGTYLSALTMMALSGVAFGEYNMTWAIQLPFLALTAFIITRWVIIKYREAGIISCYEYLEQRIHVSSRILASATFTLFSVGRTAIVLYLPALAFSTVCQIPLTQTIVVMGIVITIYTVMGGLEAVIWTDAVQVCIFTFAAIYTLFAILGRMGDADFMAIAKHYNKLQWFVAGVSPLKFASIWLILETIVQTIRIYGTQQDMTQRYLATPSLSEARKSVWIGALSYIPICFMFYFIGVSLFVFYVAHPDPSVLTVKDGVANYVMRKDTVYPYFITTQLPAGLGGLLIAAIFAAAMSSIDSLMNSASTVCIEDFYRRFWAKDRDERHYLWVARGLTVFWGILATVLAVWVFPHVKYAQVAWSVMQAVFGSGMLGLMALAFLPFKVDKWCAGIAYVATFVAILLLRIDGSLCWLILPVLGNAMTFFGALALQAMFVLPGRVERIAAAPASDAEDQ